MTLQESQCFMDSLGLPGPILGPLAHTEAANRVMSWGWELRISLTSWVPFEMCWQSGAQKGRVLSGRGLCQRSIWCTEVWLAA